MVYEKLVDLAGSMVSNIPLSSYNENCKLMFEVLFNNLNYFLKENDRNMFIKFTLSGLLSVCKHSKETVNQCHSLL